MHSLTARLLVYRSVLLICLAALTLSAQQFGSTDPAGNPQNFTLFRDQQLFVMSPGTKATPWPTNIVSFDGKLNPTGAVSQLPWSGALPFQQLAIQAVAGRFLTPAKDDIALVQRSETTPTDLVLRFRDGSLPTTLSSSFTGRQRSWSDFFATSAGDLDRLYDAQGNYHDEIAAAWIEQESDPAGCNSYSVPHVAVVNYNDPTHPAVLSQRLDRADGQYVSYCALDGYEDAIHGSNYALPTYALQPTDNLVATAIGDFDGDGFNELAVAYLRGQQGIVISIAIYRYQNDGKQASLTPVNAFEIYNPNASMVGTLSLAAGDFDGSGVDQLMVGGAYWSGTLFPDGGYYDAGSLKTQPVVFLLKGGQGSGKVSSAASDGGSTAATNVVVSLGNNAYVPRQVTISGANGSWAAINGAWQVTPTANGFSLPVDSSQFGPFSGQNIQVSVAAPLVQADTMLLDAFPGLPGYSPGAIHVDDADPDGRIRVQMVSGLFHFDPSSGFGYRRRQVAMAWNARPAPSVDRLAAQDGDSHLAIFQVTKDDKLTLATVQNGGGLFGLFQTFQSLSLAAGAFRGDNDTQDPTWSLFLTGVGFGFENNTVPAGQVHAILPVSLDPSDPNKLNLGRTCVGKVTADPYSPTYYGFIPPICQIWGDNASMQSPTGPYPFAADNYLRLPAIAADLNGNSLKLGAPVHYEITKPVKAQFILEQPPQHAAYFDEGSGHGAQVYTINRYPSFNTSMQDSQKRSFNSNNQNHTDWTVGFSTQISATREWSAGLNADNDGVGSKMKGSLGFKFAYDYDKVSSDYKSTASSYAVTQQNATGVDDVLIYNSEILDLWRYRIFGSGTVTGDSQKPYAYYDIVLPGAPSIVSYPGGRDVDWYQPLHEPGNILSYPSRTSVCSPNDIGAITVQSQNVVNQVVPLISCTQQYYNGNSSSISLNFDHTAMSGSSTDYTHKAHAEVDVSASYAAGAREAGLGIVTSGSFDLDAHGGADWGQLTTSDDSTSTSTGITVNSPQGDSNHAYPYYPIFYDTDAGALKVAFGVGDLTASGAGRGFWTDYYGQQPDPALNLPNRFNATYSPNGILNGWEADHTITRKRMKGLVIRYSKKDDTGYYPLMGKNPHDGDVVMFETRVYNYSISGTATSPITVQLSVIPMDNKNNEICRSAGGQPPTYKRGGHVCPVGDRTVIGNALSAPTGGAPTVSLNARENTPTYLMWNTKGFGPAIGTALYRVYVDLITDPNNEIYPPEKPCTALPCEDALSIEPKIDPGQNDEGWSLISVEAPAKGLQAGNPGAPPPNAAQLTLGSDTPLLGGPQGNFLTATLQRPLPLSLTAFSTMPSPLHAYVSIYDGKPGEPGTQMIAAKIVQGLRPDGATVWHNWTPSTLVPHHLYATVQNSNGTHPLGDLLVDVQRSVGDLNGDGRVDTHDLNILVRDLGKSVENSACGMACDIDGDGQITETDSILMANLCDSQGCAFAAAEYVGGEVSPLEPDMRTLRAADLGARTAWFAANADASKALLAGASPVSNGLGAYRQELARKTALHSIQYFYKGKPVTAGPLVPWPPVAPAQTVIYANPAKRSGTEVDVPLVIVNSGTGPLSALRLKNLSVQTLAGSGQATIVSSGFGLPPGDFLPGASTTVSVRLNVPGTVRKLKLTEGGSLQSGSSGPYQFSGAQVIFP